MATSNLHADSILHRLLAGSGMPALVELAARRNLEATPPEAAPDDTVSVPHLAAAYRRYWSLSETGPMETFQIAYRQIVALEAHADPQVAWQTLRESAKAYYAEMGVCPFCREAGPLHLPDEQLQMELSETVWESTNVEPCR